MHHLTEFDDDLLLRANICGYHWYLKSTLRALEEITQLAKAPQVLFHSPVDAQASTMPGKEVCIY